MADRSVLSSPSSTQPPRSHAGAKASSGFAGSCGLAVEHEQRQTTTMANLATPSRNMSSSMEDAFSSSMKSSRGGHQVSTQHLVVPPPTASASPTSYVVSGKSTSPGSSTPSKMLSSIPHTGYKMLLTPGTTGAGSAAASSGAATTCSPLVLDDVARMRSALKQAVEHGVLCPETLEPRAVAGGGDTAFDLRKHGIFQLPRALKNPVFLAEGGFGTVAKCTVVRPQDLCGGYRGDVAVKRVKIPRAPEDWEDTLRLLREVHFLKHLPHTNVSPLLKLYSDGTTVDSLTHIYLVMPCYTPGSLDEFAINDIAVVRRICCGLLQALRWMHRHKVLHRDVKRENIFFDNVRQQAVLADFGMARSMVNRMTTKRGVGTRCYLAPEQLAGVEDYGVGVDIFGFGCAMFELIALSHEQCLIPMSIAGTLEHRARLYGLAGHESQPAEPDVVEKSKKAPTKKWCENRWRALKCRAGAHEKSVSEIVLRCLAYAPSFRWTADEALKHRWFTGEPIEEETAFQVTAFEAFEDGLWKLPDEAKRMKQIRQWILDIVADRTIPLPRGVRNPLQQAGLQQEGTSAAAGGSSRGCAPSPSRNVVGLSGSDKVNLPRIAGGAAARLEKHDDGKKTKNLTSFIDFSSLLPSSEDDSQQSVSTTASVSLSMTSTPDFTHSGTGPASSEPAVEIKFPHNSWSHSATSSTSAAAPASKTSGAAASSPIFSVEQAHARYNSHLKFNMKNSKNSLVTLTSFDSAGDDSSHSATNEFTLPSAPEAPVSEEPAKKRRVG
ncbi:unnamed protein product [Amoebophrya sp. A25]|nr:unnamed protein product [Amoebophrya sp. A25]|eukprot:GSA25T00016679001.1